MALTVEQTRNFLNEYRTLKLQEKQLINEIQEITTIRSPLLDGMPHGSGKSDLSNTVIRMLSKQTKWTQTIKEIRSKMELIAGAIDCVPNETQKTLLILRYVRGLTIEQAAGEMCYSFRQIFRIHKKALQAVSVELAKGSPIPDPAD